MATLKWNTPYHVVHKFGHNNPDPKSATVPGKAYKIRDLVNNFSHQLPSIVKKGQYLDMTEDELENWDGFPLETDLTDISDMQYHIASLNNKLKDLQTKAKNLKQATTPPIEGGTTEKSSGEA